MAAWTGLMSAIVASVEDAERNDGAVTCGLLLLSEIRRLSSKAVLTDGRCDEMTMGRVGDGTDNSQSEW